MMRSGGLWPPVNAVMLAITFSPMPVRASIVLEPKCGNSTAFFCVSSLCANSTAVEVDATHHRHGLRCPDGGVERVEQGRVAERLEQARYGPMRKQVRTDGPVSVGGDEDNRDLLPPT